MINEPITVDIYEIVPDFDGVKVYRKDTMNLMFKIESNTIGAFVYHLAQICNKSKVERESSDLDVLINIANRNGIDLTGEDYVKLIHELISDDYCIVGKLNEIGSDVTDDD